MVEVRRAQFPFDAVALLDIWREYVASPNVSLDYQGNEAEFADLPGKYAPPEGCVLVAECDERLIGCIAFRRVNSAICEMKRLYVRPEGRGLGLGIKLTRRLIATAIEAGYVEMRLDVLAEFEKARAIYEAIGFTAAEPVSFNPVPGTSYLGLHLK
jgi:GNAT superfamily N-acetyltransferase